jgi:hypothetical protein
MPVLLTNILLTVFAVGIFLIVRGLRGRVIGAVRHCRACNFSLEGAPSGAPCPECGRDVSKPGATRPGRFERRKVALVSGLVVTFLTLASLAVIFFGSLVDVIPDLPTPAVVWASGSRDPEVAGTALRELQDRAAANQLNDHTIRLLAMQGIAARDAEPPGRGWFWPYATFFDLARQRGLISDEAWNDYATNSLYILAIPNEQRESLSIFFQHYLTNAYSGALAPVTLDVEVASLEYKTIDGSWTAVNLVSRGRGPGSITNHSAVFQPDGYSSRTSVRVRFNARVVDQATRTPIGGDWDGECEVPLSVRWKSMRRKDGKEAISIWRY